MLRLALIVGAAIYAGLVVFSEGAPDAPVAATTISRAAAIEAPAPAPRHPRLTAFSPQMGGSSGSRP